KRKATRTPLATTATQKKTQLATPTADPSADNDSSALLPEWAVQMQKEMIAWKQDLAILPKLRAENAELKARLQAARDEIKSLTKNTISSVNPHQPQPQQPQQQQEPQQPQSQQPEQPQQQPPQTQQQQRHVHFGAATPAANQWQTPSPETTF
ncbi:hypothetical protein, partial, partial [Parasitella parasitica]